MILLKNKKGVSPVIATVLLISLAIVLASIIFMWMRGFVSEQIEKQGQPIDQVCKRVDFEIESDYLSGGRVVVLQVINRGNVNIYGLDIEFVGKRESAMEAFTFNTYVGESSDIQEIKIIGEAEKLILHPIILGSVQGKNTNKQVTCLEVSKTVNLE